jgi:hypothetical protein
MTKGKKQTLKAVVSMCSFSDGNKNGMIIHITDADSRLIVAEVRISGDENIANLFRSRECNGTAEIFPAAAPKYGMKQEVKTVTLYGTDAISFHNDEDASNACDIAEQSNPGWEADSSCRKFSFRKRNSDGSYQITLRRWDLPSE